MKQNEKQNTPVYSIFILILFKICIVIHVYESHVKYESTVNNDMPKCLAVFLVFKICKDFFLNTAIF